VRVDPTAFVYVGDVMCSWCWGFSVTVRALRERFAIPIELVNGGIRPGPSAERLDEHLRATLAHHWRQVAAASGQPFATEFLDRADGWLYDSELPAMAVVTVRRSRPELTLEVFERLQRGFYAEGIDVTDPNTYRSTLAGFDMDLDAFEAEFTTEEARWAAWEDFEAARGLGVAGFPTLFLRWNGGLRLVTRGFAPPGRLVPAVESFLRNELGADAAGNEGGPVRDLPD
jgi:putative protein-disulfide isomerase